MRKSERERILNEAKFGFSAEKAVSLAYSRQPTPVKNVFKGAFQVAAVLSEAWMATTNDRRGKFSILNNVMTLPIAKTIVKLISYDVLNPDKKGDSIKFVAKDDDKALQTKYQEELDQLSKKYNFNTLLQQIVRDLILFGEQAVRLSVKRGEGLTGINNDVDILNLVALYEQGVPKRYLRYAKNDYYMYPAAAYAHFVVGSNTMRVKLEDCLIPGYSLTNANRSLSFATNGQDAIDIPDWAKEELPDFIQMGEPLFDGFISKIKELQLLESLVVATKLNQITQSSVLGIPVSNSMNPDEATAICREWEERLNVPTSIDFSKSQIGVADVIGQTGILKVVPIVADGKVENLSIRTNIPVDDLIKAINDVRKMITSNLGVPYTLIYGPENEATGQGGNKASELRMHARYVRMLASIQLALRNGLIQIILTHFENLGPDFKDFNKDSFDIEFINALTDISELEKFEIMDAKNEIVMNAIDGVLKFYSNPVMALMLNPQAVMDKLSEDLAILSPGHKLIKKQAPIELYKKDFLLSLKVAYDGGGIGVDTHSEPNQLQVKGEDFATPEEELEAIKRLQLNEAHELIMAALSDPLVLFDLKKHLIKE